MIIDDLDYVEAVLGASKLVGAGYTTSATGSAHTFATYGFGSADANAFAIGKDTSTLANTYTKVYVNPYIAFTEASATANSYARTENSYSVSLNDSRSLFIFSSPP
ncbi:hypothetical protein [Microcoleus sp. S13_B4]|uniref:hypothetical protein n=1 Tax=Microcoleus sp. S13_B4 TaxID=3055408 RepID=UPI002FD211F5